MSKTINRIMDLVSALNISARQFDIAIGTGNGYTLRMKKNNASVGSDVIERIKQEFPQVNLVWLITGKGNMFVTDANNTTKLTELDIKAYIAKRLEQNHTKKKNALLDEIQKEIEQLRKETNQ